MRQLTGRETSLFVFIFFPRRPDPKLDPTPSLHLSFSRATYTSFLGAATAFDSPRHRIMGEPEVTGSGGVEENREYDEYDDEMMVNPTSKVWIIL